MPGPEDPYGFPSTEETMHATRPPPSFDFRAGAWTTASLLVALAGCEGEPNRAGPPPSTTAEVEQRSPGTRSPATLVASFDALGVGFSERIRAFAPEWPPSFFIVDGR